MSCEDCYDKLYLSQLLDNDALQAGLAQHFNLKPAEVLISSKYAWLDLDLFDVRLVCEVKKTDSEDFPLKLQLILMGTAEFDLPDSLDDIEQLSETLKSHILVNNVKTVNRYIKILVRGKGDRVRVHLSPGPMDKHDQPVIDEYLDK